MLRKMAALGVALTVIMVPGMTAQKAPPRVTHATIGMVKQVDAQNHTIVVTPIGGTDQSYAFSAKTKVHGLPGGTRVPALGSKLGDKVVVHFAVAAEKPAALEIEYLGSAEIQQLAGTVMKVDHKARTFTLKPATGTAEEFVIAPRAVFDMKSGTVTLANFTRLTNVAATVFYTTRGNEKLVWYLQEVAAPAVSVR
jgi:hypothetical protein